MKFDDIVTDIGEFGPYQIKVFLMVGLIGIPVGFNQMAQVFFAIKSDHWCAVDEWRVDYQRCGDQAARGERYYLECLHALRNASIPYSIDDDNNGELVFEHCSKYDLDYAEFNWTEAYLYEESEEPKERDCDDGWIYDRSQYPRTIISDFNLVCNSEKAADIAQSIFFAGVLAGSFIFGSVSDIVGRYYTYYTAVVLLAVFPLINAFAPSFWLYVLFRFFIAAANMGTFLIAFVIGTELVGPSKRVTANCMIQCTFAVGYMLLAVVAYFVRDWRILQLTIVAPTFLFIFTIPFVTESPRWLISKRRFSDAAKIITKAAKFNKKEDRLPPNFIQEIQKSEEHEHDSALKTATFIDLFRTPNLRISTLNCMYNWFINSLVYYGLSLSTSDLGSNIYIAFFISGAVEIPAYIVGIPMMESRLGRRYSTSICEILGGVACLLTIFLPPGGWKTMIAMIGKFGISASFSLIYIYSAEVIPTPLRSVGVGMCSTAARVGGILAPLILLLDDVWEPLPLLIFGFSAVIGGILVLYLPETRGKMLPETIEEGEVFSSRRKEHVVDNKEYQDIPNQDV